MIMDCKLVFDGERCYSTLENHFVHVTYAEEFYEDKLYSVRREYTRMSEKEMDEVMETRQVGRRM